jgi:hypothetical protein
MVKTASKFSDWIPLLGPKLIEWHTCKIPLDSLFAATAPLYGLHNIELCENATP